jgi:curved DNA-binding protein CbpA
MSAADYYAILGVDPSENPQGIQAAYRKLAKQCHPDRAGVEGTEQFQAIQEAYEVLSDPGRRKEYDAEIDRRSHVRRPSRVEAEPLAPAPQPAWFSEAEPLIPPSSAFYGRGARACAFCHGRSAEGVLCPVCRPFDLIDQNTARFIMNFLRTFRLGGL